MRVSAIVTTYDSYYYNPNVIARLRTVKETKKVIQTKDNATYLANLYNNSAQYVKDAYEVSFRPLELIQNFHSSAI